MNNQYDNYRIENVQYVTYNGKDNTFFALYVYNEESNAFIYDHTGNIKGHYKRKDTILNRYFKDDNKC